MDRRNDNEANNLTIPIAKKLKEVTLEMIKLEEQVRSLTSRLQLTEEYLIDSKKRNLNLTETIHAISLDCVCSHQCPVRNVIKE